MSNLKKIETDRSKDVREALEFMLGRSDELEAVVIIAIQKSGSQEMRSSNSSGYEKAFMLQFFQAWMSKWFFNEV